MPDAAAVWDDREHPRRPGGTGGGQFTRRPGGGPAETAEALDAALKSDRAAATRPGEGIGFTQPAGMNYFGNTADTAIITFADGSKWVRKRGIPEDAINREVAYSRVAGVLGAGAAPAIKRAGPDGTPEMYAPYVEGLTAIEWAGGQDPDAEDYDPGLERHHPEEMYFSRRGHLIGFTDQLAGISDRHMGNWVVTPGGPVPIDNESASFSGDADYEGSNFARYTDLSQFAGEHTPQDWQRWRAGLAALRGEFAALGMAAEWRTLMANFDDARRGAGVP